MILLTMTACGSSDAPTLQDTATASASPTATPTSVENDLTVSSGILCGKLDTGIGTSLNFTYESVFYLSGDRFVYCEVADTAKSYSAAFVYKSGSTAAATGSCQLVYDVDSASFGYWTFTSQSGTTKAKYTDSPSTHNNYTYTYVSGDCTSF